MSTAVAPIATPVNTELPGSKGANWIRSNDSAIQHGSLKSPDLLHPTDIELIRSMTGDEFNKWKLLYSQADQYQQQLKKGWKEYRKENLKKPDLKQPDLKKPDLKKPDLDDDENEYNSPDLQILQENHKKHTENVTANLKGLFEINGKIQALNRDNGKHNDFGKASLPIMCPSLEDAGQWDKIQKKLMSNQEALLKISDYFSLGYSLQKIFIFGTQALDDNFDEAYVKAIQAIIKRLNSSIRSLKLDKKIKSLGRIKAPDSIDSELSIPEQTMQGYETDDSDDEDDEDEDGEDESDDEVSDSGSDLDMGDGSGDRPEAPDQVMKVLTSMGGDGGLLQRVLLAIDERFQITDKELEAKFQECQEKIKQLTLEAKIDNTGTMFQINLGQLKIGIGKTQEVYSAIREDPGNEDLQQQYQALRKEAAEFMATLGYPENFVDALAPSAQGIIDASQKEPIDPSTKYAPELDKIMERFGAQDGCLSRYLHSKADGKTDKVAKTEVLKLREAISALLGPENSGLLDDELRVYNFSKEKLEQLVELVTTLKTLEKECEADPSPSKKFNLSSALDAAKNTLGHKTLCEAVIGDIETSQRFMGHIAPPGPGVLGLLARPGASAPLRGKLTSSKKNRRGTTAATITGTIAAPSIEDEASDIMVTQSDPTIIQELVDGRLIEKRILHVKRISRTVNKYTENEHSAVVGWQLVLKYHDKGRYKYPSFEMVAGSTYPGAVQGFRKAGGTEFEPGTKEDLRSCSDSDIDICGVMPVGGVQDPYKDLNQSQRLLLRVCFKKTKKFMFFYISTLRSRFGAKWVDQKRDLYAAGAGQVLAVAVPHAVERTAYRTEIENLKNQLLGNPPAKTRKVPYSRRPPVVIVGDDNIDESGEDHEELGGAADDAADEAADEAADDSNDEDLEE